MQKEYRFLNENIILNDNKIIEGYAVIFNSKSEDLGGFIELIDKEALNGVIEVSDVYALLNHKKDNGVLARSKFGKGTLKLEVDNKGLKYSFEVPNTSLGNDTYEMIKRGDINASSFAFTVAEDEWTKENDKYIRKIKKINKLYDISPVYTPAYSASTVECKRFAEILEEEKIENEKKILEILEKEAEERKLIEAEEKKKEIENYYAELQNRINKIK